MKRWLAAMLTIAIALSDCGSFPVLATENSIEFGSSVSENNTVSYESPDNGESCSDDNAKNSIDDNTPEPKPELPALHIGQIKKGEILPFPDDDEVVYDLPVSFEMSDQVVLFVNYNPNAILEEENGALVWNILRGEKGMAPGSICLVQENDDWTDFETVSSSPYFTLTENKDENSDYYNTAELVLKDTAVQENYDYYIRAAYYPESENAESESFYAAVTVPFLPQNTDTEEIQDDTAAIEDTQSDSVSDNTTAVEDIAKEEIQDKEAVYTTSDDMDADDADSLEDGNNLEQTPESVSEISKTADPVSYLSENNASQQPTRESFGVLTLDAENVTLHTNDTLQISATLEPENTDTEITWSSSDAAIVSVAADISDVNGSIANITALSSGTAEITAKYGDDAMATVKVTVVTSSKEDDVYDLSGDIWVAGFQKESDEIVYTGQKITQDIRVYYRETLLQEKTDYTLSYKNNINAAVWNSAKAPCVTITLRGQYQGSVTLYYTINPADIADLDIYNPPKGEEAFSGYKQTVNYSKNLKLPNPELSFGGKKLAVNKDFVCDYTPLLEELQQKDYKKGDSYEVGKVYHYTVNGNGNFTGSIPMQLVVLKDKNLNFNSAAVTLSQKQYAYRGKDLSKTDVAIAKLILNRQVLDPELYAYDVYTAGTDGSYIMVYPTAAGESEGYRGFKKVALKLVGDRNIKDAAFGENWKEEIYFSQKAVNEADGLFQAENGVLTFGTEEEVLIEGQDYTVKYSNAKKAGTVTATFTGKGRYKGTLSKKYKILPNIDKENFTIRWKNVTREGNGLAIAYQKGGAVPDFVLLDQDNNVLSNKTDYTAALKNNKMPGISMSCVITGKGNYKGFSETVLIMVKNGDISLCTLSVPDKPYSTKGNAWKSNVTVKDVNGKTLAAGKDYEKEVTYSYMGMENEQLPAAGTTVTVTVNGKDFYAGSSLTGNYRVFQNNISKLQIVLDDQEFTGKEITLSPKDIHVYATAADKRNKIELPNAESCYKIVEYKNNIKAGTAKVTLCGDAEYGGTRTCSFRILKKAYSINRVKGITLNNKTLTLSMIELQDESSQTGTLTATIQSEKAEKIANPTVIWTSSNNNIVAVEETAPNITGRDVTTTATSTARIRAKKEGTVTITATTQDGSKKASCKVTITNKPIFIENGQTIREKVGATYQLNLQYVQTADSGTAAVKWESSDPETVSVDNTGLLTMKKTGSAVITVTVSKYKFTGQCYIFSMITKEDIPEERIRTYIREAGTSDDTDAINWFLRDWEWNNPDKYDCLYIPAGDYWINAASGGLILTDNQTLILDPDAKLHAIGNDSTNSSVIWAFGRDNITISGGQIIGERMEHVGSDGEWGHGISISGCTNVTITGVDISQCWGDGIYLGLYDGWDANGNRKQFYSSGVTIVNCNLHDNRRNNLSITDADTVTIDNCRFVHANGTDPQFGIDIEPNTQNHACKNITILNSTFTENRMASMGIMTPASDIRLENCSLDGDFINWSGKNVVLKNTTIKGEITDKTRGIKYEK